MRWSDDEEEEEKEDDVLKGVVLTVLLTPTGNRTSAQNESPDPQQQSLITRSSATTLYCGLSCLMMSTLRDDSQSSFSSILFVCYWPDLHAWAGHRRQLDGSSET